MTLRWIEGFEIDDNYNALAAKYTWGGGVHEPTMVNGHDSTQALWNFILRTPTFTAKNTWVVGFDLKSLGTVSTIQDLITFRTGATTDQIKLALWNGDGGASTDWYLYVYRGSTLLGTTPLSYSGSTWYYVELKVLVHPTAGAYELRINEETVLSASGVDTADAGSAGADAFRWDSGNVAYDNLYLLDTDGDVNNDFLGIQVIEGLLPVSDGGNTDWVPYTGTDHYAMVDDDPYLPNNDDLASGSAGAKDSFGMEDLVKVQGMIQGVATMDISRLDTALSGTNRHIYISPEGDETLGESMTVDFGAGVDGTSITIDELKPGTENPWDPEDINDGEFGLELET